MLERFDLDPTTKARAYSKAIMTLLAGVLGAAGLHRFQRRDLQPG
jgi:hypothetical protein